MQNIITLEKLDHRIPAWNLKKLIERTCPFCSSGGEAKFVRPDNLAIKYCNLCQSFFVSPAPDKAQLEDFYARYQKDHNPVTHREYWARYLLELDPFTDFRIREISSNLTIQDKKVLDVGFGLGQNMVALKKLGAQVGGVELDPEAITFAQKFMDIQDVRNCSILELDDGPAYDLVILHDFIEHPLNPIEVLEKIKNLLKPGGLISLWTPNADYNFRDTERVMFRIDLEHLQYLSSKTCLYLAEMLQIEIIHLESVGFPFIEAKMTDKSARNTKFSNLKLQIKSLIKTLPGYRVINQFGKALKTAISAPLDIRRGNYHLFCILKKLS